MLVQDLLVKWKPEGTVEERRDVIRQQCSRYQVILAKEMKECRNYFNKRDHVVQLSQMYKMHHQLSFQVLRNVKP